MSRFDRLAARRYVHRFPWRSCRSLLVGVCLRCWWRDLTGQTRRARQAHIEEIRGMK